MLVEKNYFLIRYCFHFVSGSLAYHQCLDDGTVLSLQFAHSDRERVETEKQKLRQEAKKNQAQYFRSQIRSQSYDRTIHTLYSAEIYPRKFPDKHVESLSQRDSLIVNSLLEAFMTIEKQWEKQGDPLKWYKRPDIPRIVEEITETCWRQPIPDVAGCLLSNLIFGHPLL